MPETIDTVNVVRIQETAQAVDVLEKRMTEWLDIRVAKDNRQQYNTLLSTLRTQLLALVTEVRTAFAPISATASRGVVYATCRLADKRLLWIERLWQYFSEKFNQREHPLYRDVLAAADEVVWSCYDAPFRATGRHHATVPLPWIAAEYSPRALGRSDVPQTLRSDVDAAFLAKMLQELPVPLINLPPQCVQEPWWLIYLAHEIGHQVQFDLLPDRQLVGDFGALVKGAIADEDDGERWRFRGEEIFADVYSLYMTGPWALWALTELEWTTDAGMLDDNSVRYPAPAARLLLMSRILDKLQFKGTTALRGFPDVAAIDTTSQPIACVATVADAVETKPIAGGKTFAQLCDWRATEHRGRDSTVLQWRETFLRTGTMVPEETLSAARLALAGGVAAWAEVSLETDATKRRESRASLAARLTTALCKSHEPIVRAAAIEHAMTSTASTSLRTMLFESDPASLGAW